MHADCRPTINNAKQFFDDERANIFSRTRVVSHLPVRDDGTVVTAIHMHRVANKTF
jgi:hypothetical protein